MIYEIEYRRPSEAGVTGRLRVPAASDVESQTSRLLNQGYVITNVQMLSDAQMNTGRPSCSSFES